MRHSLAHNSVIADSETLGLNRGEGLHEVSVFNMDTNEADEFILTPHRVVIDSAVNQENTKLASSVLDKHKLEKAGRWLETIKNNLGITGPLSDHEIMSKVKQASPWLAEAIHKYPHLLGLADTKLAERQKAMGLARFTSRLIDPEDLGKQLKPLLAGKTVWFANAAFDAKQIGAVLAATGQHEDLKSILETAGPSSDPFYVTGVEVNKARAMSQQTGDWTHVWKAYKAHTPKAGETAVRDIQDVLRATMSYGQKLGMLGGKDAYWGTSLDTSYRLMASIEDPTQLLTKESHRAAEDTAIHSKYVLERALRFSEALENVHAGTDVGKDLIKQAKQGVGDLYHVSQYLARLEQLRPDIKETALVQRMGRAASDIAKQGKTWQNDGYEGIRFLDQKTPSGADVKVAVNKPHRISLDSLTETAEFLNAGGNYGHDAKSLVPEFEKLLSSTDPEAAINEHVASRTKNMLSDAIAKKSKQILGANGEDAIERLQPKLGAAAMAAMPNVSFPKLGMVGIAGAVGVTALGILATQFGSKPEKQKNPSIVTYDYQQWLGHQSEFFGMDDGRREQGVNAQMRHSMTDFGSPYQGTAGSDRVFHDQKVLAARENYLRQQYGVRHYDSEIGLFGFNSVFSKIRHQGYSYISGTDKVADGYAGLQGRNLMRANIGDGSWKLSVADADTVVLKKGGLWGALAGLVGANEGYSFRLAGIDAPEISHRGHKAQPGAEEAITGIKALLAQSKNLELVYDPTQTTYGRQLGVLVDGDKNLNYEMVKRGNVAHLPFGKAEKSMINYGTLKALEEKSAKANRGMWSQNYWKVWHDVYARSGQSITFNTFASPESTAKKQSTMDTLALMEQAQATGIYGEAEQAEAKRIGKFTNMWADDLAPHRTGSSTAFYSTYLHEQQSDTNTWMTTHGTGNKQNRFSSRQGYGKLDKAMVLDSMGHTNSVWAKRRLNVMDQYGHNLDRRYSQMLAQQQVNSTMFDSHINHTRMQ